MGGVGAGDDRLRDRGHDTVGPPDEGEACHGGTGCEDGSDYISTSGTLTFEPGETEKTVQVPVCNDAEEDSRETFWLRLSNGDGAVLEGAGAVDVARGRIFNSEPERLIAVTDVEGREGAAVSFTVTLAPAATAQVTVDYATADRTAVAGEDYTAVGGTLASAPGETEKTVEVALLADGVEDGGERFWLKLSNVKGGPGLGGLARGVGRIHEPVAVSFGASRYAATEGGAAVEVAVSLDGDPGVAVTVPLVAAFEGGAGEGDFEAALEATFEPGGALTRTVALRALEDGLAEDGERVVLGFGTLPGGFEAAGTTSATVSLEDAAAPDPDSPVERFVLGGRGGGWGEG